MTTLPLLAAGFIMNIAAVLFVICSVVLILVILIQKGKGGGLSAALGGGTASGILGSKTGDFLTWLTIVLVSVFLGLGIVLAKFYRPTISDYNTGPGAPQTQPAEGQPTADREQPSAANDVATPVTDVNKSGATGLPKTQ
jgi:preprotein translocase subunit SecG